MSKRWRYHLIALRPRQWTKNLVVFAVPLFAFSLNIESLLGSLLAFILFCCASSGFYLINDLADVESDRRHPVKCNRPIAAGFVKVPVAIFMASVLLGIALIVSWLKSAALGTAITLYILLQIAYNLKLKHIVIPRHLCYFHRIYTAGFCGCGLPLILFYRLGFYCVQRCWPCF